MLKNRGSNKVSPSKLCRKSVMCLPFFAITSAQAQMLKNGKIGSLQGSNCGQEFASCASILILSPPFYINNETEHEGVRRNFYPPSTCAQHPCNMQVATASTFFDPTNFHTSTSVKQETRLPSTCIHSSSPCFTDALAAHSPFWRFSLET